MRAAEGQKWSYVEMILSSEVEVKLRCGLWCERGGRPAQASQDPIHSEAGGGGRGDQDRPKTPQEGLKTSQDGHFYSKIRFCKKH